MVVDIIFGFLGSGKTTFITRVLNEWGDKERIVVLVNEFGEVGVDGSLLQEQGGNVVEMPSGCICCTLQTDFRSQLLDIMQTLQPQRLIIEPTGVATIAQIRSIVEAQLFEKAISTIHYVLITDATGFMGLYRANPHFVESQVRNARAILLNKCDRVDKRRAMLTRDAISAINPEATVIPTEFGVVDWSQYQFALSTPLGSETHPPDPVFGTVHQQDEAIADDRKTIHLHDEEDALGYESFGLVYDELVFDEADLANFFRRLEVSELGEVIRAKGIFRVGGKSMLMELASGEFSSQPVRPAEQSKVSVIGRKLDRKGIGAALERCVSLES
jgi:G3E family GTPase